MNTSTHPVDNEAAELRQSLVHLADCAAEAADRDLQLTAGTLIDLLSVAQVFREDSSSQTRADEIVGFCRDALNPLMDAPNEIRSEIDATVEERWAEVLDLLEPQERYCSVDWVSEDGPWQSSDEGDDEELPQVSIDLKAVLASLTAPPGPPESVPDSPTDVAESSVDVSHDPLPPVQKIDDAELAAAFADDAQLCLAEMESSLLQLDSDSGSEEALNRFRRQLHTLKGASGTVGLSDLAGWLHRLETYVEETSGAEIDIDRLLAGVDAVRNQLQSLGGVGDSVPIPVSETGAQTDDQPAAGPAVVSSRADDGQLFVRVEAARLDRLMDLLAELVMLRNRRDSYVQSLQTVQEELGQCTTRTQTWTSMVEFSGPCPTGLEDARLLKSNNANIRMLSRSLEEVSRDTAELRRSLQEVVDPLSEDNSAVSHLIGRFRQELMEIRRLPVGGLFQRLQRVIRDTARTEGKRVELRIEGRGARAERVMQERLFEPLMHLVRNAVSHGIEPETDRLAAGKSAAGQLTLFAQADATSLCVEVRDDGKGLDYEAIEARGRELGLVQPGEIVERSKLWNLIFRPGFSTKSSVSEISGRGVGMDVVDNWIRRLRGRIEVDSTPGRGTTFRLQIPLRSAVEHAMVVRCGGQLFAMPMHTIGGTSGAAGERLAGQPQTEVNIQLSTLLGLPRASATQDCHVILRSAAEGQKDQKGVALGVDVIVGVEEVVVRALPPLLQRNELLAGVTLSGRAETVLVLDVDRVLDLINNGHAGTIPSVTDTPAEQEHHDRGKRILLVDDSVSVRRSLARKLRPLGFEILEAANGREAVHQLKQTSVVAVISDVDMPEMDGLSLLKQIRSDSTLSTIPVALLSSRDSKSLAEQAADLNPATIQPKPVTDVVVTELVTSFSPFEQH